MTRRLSKTALALYPLAFRRRYGAEMLVLIEDSAPGARAVIDLLRGALLAHIRPPARISEALSPEERIRASASAILASWLAFAAAGFGFYKTTEDHSFSRIGDAHLALGGTHVAIQFLAVLASIAILAGATPLVLAALRQAGRDRTLRRATGLAVGSIALFAVLTMVLVVLAHSARTLPSAAKGAAFLIWILAGLVCGVVCAFAASRGLFALRVRRRGLVAALACGTLVSAAMALIAVATAIYMLALALDAAGIAAAGNGPFGVLSVEISIAIQLVVMLFAASLASVASRRGWRAMTTAAPR
jgi:hypothetical protein